MIQILLIAGISLLAQVVLPWWTLALVAFGICYWRSSGAGQAFWFGFAGISLVWFAYALLIHVRTDDNFIGRMGQLLFQVQSAVLPLLATTVLSGLVGGLSGLSGFLVRRATANPSAGRVS